MEFKRIGPGFVNQQMNTTSDPIRAEEAQEPAQTSNNEISSAYGNRDTWQNIDQTSTLELGLFGRPAGPVDAQQQAPPGGDSNADLNREFPELFLRYLDPLSNLSRSSAKLKASNDPEGPTTNEIKQHGSVFRKKP